MMTIARRRFLARLPAPRVSGGSRTPSRLFARIGESVPRRVRGAAAADVAGRKASLGAAGAIVAGLLASFPTVLVAAPLLAALGWRLPDVAGARVREARRNEVREALPDLLDLLAICALAGMGLDPAMRLVARRIPGPLGSSLRAMLHALAVGVPRDRAYQGLVRMADTDEVRRVVSALGRAERYGSSVAATLAAQAADLRARRRVAAAERAHGAPVRMLFPLALCFLPAFVLLTVAPSLIAALRAFRGL